jgi:hypothetical protein
MLSGGSDEGLEEVEMLFEGVCLKEQKVLTSLKKFKLGRDSKVGKEILKPIDHVD